MKKRILFFLVALGMIGSSLFLAKTKVAKGYFDFSKVKRVAQRMGRQDVKVYKMLVLYTKGLGEKETSQRLQNAARKMGWECHICSTHLNFWQGIFLDKPLERVITDLDPDFLLILEGKEKIPLLYPQYVCLSGGLQNYLSNEAKMPLSQYLEFDGILPAFSDIQKLREEIEKTAPEKKIFSMPFYPTCEKTVFTPVVPRRLFYCGANWDKRRGGKEYQKFFHLLNHREVLDVYGPKKKWKKLTRSYRGSLPFDGKSVQKAMKESGIALVLHSDTHLRGDAPTARIFEAAAAGCIIISDKHPFVQREFGECVLYIDQDQKGEELFSQVEKHIKWIEGNPERAKRFAQRAHEIFVEKFSLEEQLLALARCHEKALNQKDL